MSAGGNLLSAAKELLAGFASNATGSWLNSGICPACLGREGFGVWQRWRFCRACWAAFKVVALGGWIFHARQRCLPWAGDGERYQKEIVSLSHAIKILSSLPLFTPKGRDR